MTILLREITHNQEILNYQLVLSKRRTLAIMVYPDQSVIVKAPLRTNIEDIQDFVKKRAAWIKSKIQHFEKFTSRRPPKKYIDGEIHFYLGNAYPLKLLSGTKTQVLLKEACIELTCKDISNSESVRKILEAWYVQQAKIVFETLMLPCWQIFNRPQYKLPKLRVRKMKTRWGSISLRTLMMTLNSELLKSSKECIEYVIFHEFCHLKYRYHNSQFYHLLGQVLPEWKEWKVKLESSIF